MADDLKMTDYVHFAGYLSKEDWRDCYAGSDLFVFASITETQGLVVTEAMAAETPVVAVGEMGIKDVMASGKGGLVTRLNEDEFTDAVRKMLTDNAFTSKRRPRPWPRPTNGPRPPWQNGCWMPTKNYYKDPKVHHRGTVVE